MGYGSSALTNPIGSFCQHWTFTVADLNDRAWVESGRAGGVRKGAVDAGAPGWKTEWPLWEVEGSKLTLMQPQALGSQAPICAF